MKKSAMTMFVAALAFATSSAYANSPNGTNFIEAITLHDSGHVFIRLSGSSNTEGCATSGLQNLIVLHKDYFHYKLMYAMALEAMAMGKPISGWVNGCVDIWGSGTLMLVKATTLDLSK